jgi:inosine-uridine nucleoside N-ribohydrolase
MKKTGLLGVHRICQRTCGQQDNTDETSHTMISKHVPGWENAMTKSNASSSFRDRGLARGLISLRLNRLARCGRPVLRETGSAEMVRPSLLRWWMHLCIASLIMMPSLMLSSAYAVEKTPVILDTDIGGDIDDTWALALLLKCPELDLKLVVGDMGQAEYRAKLIAKMLETAGRTDVPVGVGLPLGNDGVGRQQKWVENYSLADYPGTVHQDGVQAIIDVIMQAEAPITLICVGPVPNIKAALEREPRIAQKALFVGMHGAVRKGYGGSSKVTPEYNVVADIPACQAVFTAPWRMTITPLDTCGLVHLRGEKYAKVFRSDKPLAQAVMKNYHYWWQNMPDHEKDPTRPEKASSTLFDTVAVYLAFRQDLCRMETLPIRVNREGVTVIDQDDGKPMQVATEWKNLEEFENFLVDRLTK